MSVEFQVKKDDLPQYRIVECEDQPLQVGEIRLKIDQFSFTANNLTYGVAGYSLGYWQFFPAADNTDQLWGVIPVWAFADVAESNNEAIPVGDRLYGYFPPATHLTMHPQDVTTHTLVDGAAHRQKLPPLYNRYRRVLADPSYDKRTDAARILLAPLHITSFCLWDCLKNNDWYGAEQIVIVSASSKTSLGLAYGLFSDDTSPSVIGLTSERNADFVASTGLYQDVIVYASLTETLADRPTVVVDMAGNAAVANSLQEKLGDKLVYNIRVGLTHWDAQGRDQEFSKPPKPGAQENFFAPSYILQRFKDWGPAEFEKRSAAFIAGSARATFGWMAVETHDGVAGLAEIYPGFCDGTCSPAAGQVIKM